jgi:hypothetical protein
MDLHDDDVRRRNYMQSRLILSEFGGALLEGRADLVQHNTIDRWWGGTRLTNDHRWRWDTIDRNLVCPS